MKRILIQKPDGEIDFLHPSPRARAAFKGTDEEFLAALAAKRVPVGCTWAAIDESDYPGEHRAYRRAWRANSGRIEIDLDAAREIHRNRIRSARKPVLEHLDSEWMKAMGQGDAAKAAVVEAKRQALRDAPASTEIDSAKTIDDLKAVWPEVLR